MKIDQVKELLPKQLLDIAEAIGLPATQRLFHLSQHRISMFRLWSTA